MPHLLGVLPVDHGPLVQAEAAQVGGARRRTRQQVADEAHRLPAGGHQLLDVQGGAVTVEPVEAPVAPVVAAGQGHARAGVPPPQLGRAVGVVREQEVGDRVPSAAGAARQVLRGEGVHPLLVGALQRPPHRLRDRPHHHGVQGVRGRWVASCRAHREIHHR